MLFFYSFIFSLNNDLANSTKWKLVGNIVGIGNSVTVPTIAKECLIITHNKQSNVKTSFVLTENELKEVSMQYENGYYRDSHANGSLQFRVNNYTIALSAIFTNGISTASSSANAVVYYR